MIRRRSSAPNSTVYDLLYDEGLYRNLGVSDRMGAVLIGR